MENENKINGANWRAKPRAMSLESIPFSPSALQTFALIRSKLATPEKPKSRGVLANVAKIRITNTPIFEISRDVDATMDAKAEHAFTIASDFLLRGFSADPLSQPTTVLLKNMEGTPQNPQDIKDAEKELKKALGPAYKVMLRMILQKNT